MGTRKGGGGAFWQEPYTKVVLLGSCAVLVRLWKMGWNIIDFMEFRFAKHYWVMNFGNATCLSPKATNHFPTSSPRVIPTTSLNSHQTPPISSTNYPDSITSYNRMSVLKTLKRVKQMIPPLSAEMHKGQAGRVGVIGGCEESVLPFLECQVNW